MAGHNLEDRIRLSKSISNLSEQVALLINHHTTQPFMPKDNPSFVKFRPIRALYTLGLGTFSIFNRPKVDIVVDRTVTGVMHFAADNESRSKEQVLYETLEDNVKHNIVGDALRELLKGNNGSKAVLTLLENYKQRFQQSLLDEKKSPQEAMMLAEQYSEHLEPYAQLSVRQLSAPINALRKQFSADAQPSLQSMFSSPDITQRLEHQWMYALSPHMIKMPVQKEYIEHEDDHYLVISANLALNMLGMKGIYWDSKNQHWQYQERSYLKTNATRISINPLRVFRRKDSWKKQIDTTENVAMFGLVERMQLSPITIPVLNEIAGLVEPYHPNSKKQFSNGIAELKTELGVEPLDHLGVTVSEFLQEEHERNSNSTHLDQILANTALSSIATSRLSILYDILNVNDTIATFSKLCINGPNVGDNLSHDVDLPPDEQRKRRFFVEEMGVDKKHAYWFFSGAEQAYPLYDSELSKRSGIIYRLTHYLAWSLEQAVLSGEKKIHHLRERENPLQKIVDGASIEEQKTKLAEWEGSIKSFFTNVAGYVMQKNTVEHLMGMSIKKSDAISHENGLAAFIKEHYILFAGALISKISSNLAAHHRKGKFLGALDDLRHTVFSFNPLRYAEFGLNMIRSNENRIHQLHGKEILYNLDDRKAKNALEVGLDTYFGDFENSSYRKSLRGVSGRLHTNPGDIGVLYATGFLLYQVGMINNDQKILEEAEYNLKDVEGFVKDAGHSKLEHLGPGKRDELEKRIVPASEYMLAHIQHKARNPNYHTLMETAYTAARVQHELETPHIPQLSWQPTFAKSSTLPTSLVPRSIDEMLDDRFFAPFDFANRVQLIASLNENMNRPIVEKELHELYFDIESVREVITAQDLGAFYALSRYFDRKKESTMPRLSQKHNDAFSNIYGWFLTYKHDLHDAANKHSASILNL